MKIAVLGTGTVGETIGSALIAKGHEVKMGRRTATNEKAAEWVSKSGANASTGTFADAAAFGGIIINATKGANSIDVLNSVGAASLNGKILIDVANPLDFSKGMPPSLIPSLSNTNSLGEEIQKTFPEVKVVKTLNTMWCGLMVNPTMIGGGDHINYLCGNDTDAKTEVKKFLINNFGWKEENLLDLGDICNARGTESVLPIWLRVFLATNNGAFYFKLVK